MGTRFSIHFLPSGWTEVTTSNFDHADNNNTDGRATKEEGPGTLDDPVEWGHPFNRATHLGLVNGREINFKVLSATIFYSLFVTTS